ncbi:MAG: hypothetical protein F6K42_34600, partial [Leptolyngbya sp. SIO1D8]|nr:hypothetical protein [Leptolyngbya sp. SIO1D8]
MTAWEDLQLGPMLGWRHLVGSRTTSFARRPLGRFTILSAAPSSVYDAQSLAAHLMGFPMPPLEALRETNRSQVNAFMPWSSDFPTAPPTWPNLSSWQPQNSPVETANIDANHLKAAPPTVPEMPLLTAQHQPLKSAKPLGNKVAERVMQLIGDRPPSPSSDSPPLQAKPAPYDASPAKPLIETPNFPADPSSTPAASTQETPEAINRHPNEARQQADVRSPETLDVEIVPDPPAAPHSQAELETIQRELPTTPQRSDANAPSIPTGVDEVSDTDAERPPHPSPSETLETVPEQPRNESDPTATGDNLPTRPPIHPALPSPETPESPQSGTFQSDTFSAEAMPLQRQVLNIPESQLP